MSFTIPSRLLTELDAVNLVLEAKGVQPATTIDQTDPDVALALQALNQADLEVQTIGWSFNSDDSMTLTQDPTTGFILLPDQTLSVANTYWPQGILNSGPPRRVVERQAKLYDRTNQTFVFTEAVQVDITIRLAYEDMPQAARNYVAILAAHRSQMKGQGSTSVAQITADQVKDSRTALEWAEDAASPQNQITGNSTVLGTLFASGVRRRTNWTY